jgi:hypothetical protein
MRIRRRANTPHARLTASFIAAIHIRRFSFTSAFQSTLPRNSTTDCIFDVKYLHKIYSTILCRKQQL